MTSSTFKHRRKLLAEKLGDASALFHNGSLVYGNLSSAAIPFRSSSHCLFFAGELPPGAMLLISATETVIGVPARTAEDTVWEGPDETEASLKSRTGCDRVLLRDELLTLIRDRKGTVLTIPPLQSDVRNELTEILGRTPSLEALDGGLARSIVACRLTHDPEALAEMAAACTVTTEMYEAAFDASLPGAKEYEVRAALYSVAMKHGFGMAFAPTVTIHGETLHYPHFRNELRAGALLLVDAGAESASGWSSDVTRTWPVSGKFSPEQRACYDIVLAAQEKAIEMIRPGVEWRDVHFAACRVITEGLCELKILKGDVQSLVERGAHTLFFTHGIGHLIGLDVHDMEDLGDIAGYEDGRTRDIQFGTKYLRLHRPLRENMVVSVEPGIYFVPTLMADERFIGPFRDAVDHNAVERFASVRGIRIEDTVWVGAQGGSLLTGAIPKDPAKLEAVLSRSR